MNWHTSKSLLNTSGRAVEQLAGCLAKQAKISSRGQSRTASTKLSYQYLTRNTHAQSMPRAEEYPEIWK